MMNQPSYTYQRTSKLLFERHQRGDISAEEYAHQMSQAEEEEIRTKGQLEISQAKLRIQEYELEQLSKYQRQQDEQEKQKQLTLQKEQQRLADEKQAEQERIIAEKKAEEERVQQIEDQKREKAQKMIEAEQKKQQQMVAFFHQYRDVEIPSQLEEMRRRARQNRWFSSAFQVVIIVVSTVAAGIVNIENVPRLVISILTIIVAITTGVVWIFKFKEKGINSQQTADEIDYERNLYNLGIKDYAGKTPQEAHRFFAERVEDLKHEHDKRQQLLEQSPDKQTGATEGSKTA